LLNTSSAPAVLAPRALLSQINAFREPSHARSWVELAVTAAAFASSWLLALIVLAAGNALGFLLCVPAGVFLVRLFLIQHDCGHGAFFRRQHINDWVGRTLGVVTLTPYDYWRKSHAMHHATTGNLDARGIGDVDTLTIGEFRKLSPLRRLGYRVYRHPVVLFAIGPAYQFLWRHRLPFGLMNRGWRPWASALGTNASIAAVAGLLIWAIGIKLFLLVQIPVTLVASSLGVWFFYIQHQFETTHWDRDEEWSFHAAALHGSSHYALPGVLRWLTAHVGVHHVHHLVSRVPFYRMPEVLREIPALVEVNKVGLRQSLRAVKLVLWDEGTRRLVSFAQARTIIRMEAHA
jgi:omega-6 fatty acid desaturase (delta-12 desaturase)